MQKRATDAGWTARSVAVAVAASLVSLIACVELARAGAWPQDEGWALIGLPAIIGSVVLAWRHPGMKVLAACLAFPLLWALMFYAAACLPI
jgi:hypothetical protein